MGYIIVKFYPDSNTFVPIQQYINGENMTGQGDRGTPVLALSPNGDYLYIGDQYNASGSTGLTKQYKRNLSTGIYEITDKTWNYGTSYTLISADNEYLAMFGQNYKIRVINLSDDTYVEINHSSGPYIRNSSIVTINGYKYIYTGGYNYKLQIWKETSYGVWTSVHNFSGSVSTIKTTYFQNNANPPHTYNPTNSGYSQWSHSISANNEGQFAIEDNDGTKQSWWMIYPHRKFASF